MNIIAICGSPRRGNTEFILKRFLSRAEDLGHKTELVLLRERRVETCTGCFSCDDEGICPLRDDVPLIVDRLTKNDLIVLGSPNYFNNFPGLMKTFIDRLDPAYKAGSLKGKKLISMCVGASSQTSAEERMTAVVAALAEQLELELVGDFYLVARNAQEVEDDPQRTGRIDEFAKNILS